MFCVDIFLRLQIKLQNDLYTDTCCMFSKFVFVLLSHDIHPANFESFQELMVDEMKRLCEACREAAKAKWMGERIAKLEYHCLCEGYVHVICVCRYYMMSYDSQ